MNTDASFIPSSGEAAAGMVTRNHLGQVAMSLCLKLPACKNAEEAELSAVLHGFEALSKVYKGRVCVETDCSSIPALLDHKATNQSALFPLVSDTRDIMQQFTEVTFSTIERTSNKVAHELAALARRQGNSTTVGDVPYTIRGYLVEDCNSFSS